MSEGYKAPAGEERPAIVNIDRLAARAREVMAPGPWGYLEGGAGDEVTMRRNREAFEAAAICPRVMSGVENPDISTSVLGIPLSMPIIMAPAAAHGLEHAGAEKETAAGVAAAKTIMSVSTYANDTIADIAAAGQGAPQWFQLYMSKDDAFNRHICDEALKNGAGAIIITVDATVGGNREADVVNGFKMPLPMANLETLGAGAGKSIAEVFADARQKITPDDVAEIAAYTRLPVIVKGIQCADDALTAIAAGAAAVWVSNHGGRQLDGGPASFAVLPEIARAVNSRVPIIFDSGIRRGQHVFKALASGADIVAVGRPVLYGLAVGGRHGVKAVFDFFAAELKMVMQLAGTGNIEAVKKTPLLFRR